MKFYKEWRTGSDDGSNITALQLLAGADTDYKWYIITGNGLP
jgi:hypothetical protein